MDGVVKKGVLENFMINHQKSLKSLFQRKKPSSTEEDSPAISPRPIPQLSPIANSVVCRCSKILKVPTEELQHRYDIELPESVKQLLTYARNFVEFCSYQTLLVISKSPDYLSDPEFRRLMYDMMLAWEAPCIENEAENKESPSCSNQEVEEEDGWSLFYSSSTNMAMQVDSKKTVGPEAFARIAPACAAVADVITVHNLFNALTSSSCERLHFLIYEKYIRTLDKVIKAAKNAQGPSISNLQLAEGEIILAVDGTIPTQPVLQHIGISAWPGRLTLTNHALYFESLGVGSYDKPIKYDLANELKQIIKPELTGPLGARLFDKAVMYKSISVAEPVYFEFPEFKVNSRRDYWLDISLEILRAHRFIRKNNFNKTQQSEVLARAILGIFRYRAIREAFNIFSSQYKTLLPLNLAESLPGGDKILETLSSRLALLNIGVSPRDTGGSPNAKEKLKLSPVAVLTLRQLGFSIQTEMNIDMEAIAVADVCVGETNPLELAVKQSVSDIGRAEAAQATVDQVKVEGIDRNLAVMKELMFPVIEIASRLQVLSSWEDCVKSTVFLVMTSFAIVWFAYDGLSSFILLPLLSEMNSLFSAFPNVKGWIGYVLPFICVFLAVLMLWRRHFKKDKPLEAFKITSPPNKNAVEQLLTLQEAISKVEELIQAGNIILLKIRALLFAVLPQATDNVVVLLVFIAAVFAFVPSRYIVLFFFLEGYTREMPYRKESSDRWLRRVREWWIRIPAAPVELIKLEEKKKKK